MSQNLRWTPAEYEAFLARTHREHRGSDHFVDVSKMVPSEVIGIRPTSDEAKLNKTERAFLAHLRAAGHAWIGIQNITFKLADDTRYTPDFTTFNSGLTVWEVKGFWRDDAKVKIKTAARMFTWTRFIAVSKTKSGWEQKEFKP